GPEHHEGADAARDLRGSGGLRRGALGRAAKVGGEQVDGLHLVSLIGTPLARLEAMGWGRRPRARLEESGEVPVDHRVAREQGDDSAEGEEGPEGDLRLA